MTQATGIAAASLLRVSTFAQATEGTPLDTQAEANEGFIAAGGWRFTRHYVEDEGVSGAKEEQDRPDVAALLADVRAGLIHVVVTRSRSSSPSSRSRLRARCCCRRSEPWDASTPAGRLQRTMLAVFAGYEREQIIERTSRGLRAVARP